jgi:hypothetical protein
MLKSQSWVSLLHLCMSITHSVWNWHSACLNHTLHMKSRSACINLTRTCRNHTREGHNHTHMWQNHTQRVKITLVRVETTVVSVVITFVYVKNTLRVKITLCVQISHSAYGIALCWYKSHSNVSLSHSWVSNSHAYVPKLLSCVWKPHSACKITLCVWKSYSACRNQSCAWWNHTRAYYNHICACLNHTACRNYTLRATLCV